MTNAYKRILYVVKAKTSKKQPGETYLRISTDSSVDVPYDYDTVPPLSIFMYFNWKQ